MFFGDLRDEDWRRFKVRLQSEEAFQSLEGVQGWDMDRLEKACRISWEMCMDDYVSLVNKLHEGSLRSIKQVEIMKEQLGRKSAGLEITDPDIIEVYEPLSHLDARTQELVLAVAGAKIRQLLSGSDDNPDAPGPPRKLVNALVEAGEVDSGGWKQRALDAEQRAEDIANFRQTLESQLEDSRDEASRLQGALSEKERELEKTRERELALKCRLEELNEELLVANKEISKLQQQSEKYEQELTKLHEERRRLQNEIAELKKELEIVSAKLEAAQQEAKRLQAVIAELEALAAASKSRLEALEARAKDAEAKNKELREELNDMRDRLKDAEARTKEAEETVEDLQFKLELLQRHAPKATDGTQTELRGKNIEELQANNEQHHIDANEMKEKLKALAEELEEKGLVGLLGKVGLQRFVKPPTLAERLHRDGERRDKRLAKLQEEYSQKHAKVLQAKFAHEDSFIDAQEKDGAREGDDRTNEERGIVPVSQDGPKPGARDTVHRFSDEFVASALLTEMGPSDTMCKPEMFADVSATPEQHAFTPRPPPPQTLPTAPRHAHVAVLPSARGRHGPLPWHGGFDAYQCSGDGRRRDGKTQHNGNLRKDCPFSASGGARILPKLGPLAECRKAETKSRDGVALLTVICSETDFRL